MIAFGTLFFGKIEKIEIKEIKELELNIVIFLPYSQSYIWFLQQAHKYSAVKGF